MITKYATSNKGSIAHQFSLMIFMLAVLKVAHFPTNELFVLPNLQQSNEALIEVMNSVKNSLSAFMLMGLVVIRRMVQHAVDH